MRKIALLLQLPAAIVFFVSCNNPTDSTTPTDLDTLVNLPPVVDIGFLKDSSNDRGKEKQKNSKWEYAEHIDEMDGTTRKTAMLIADNVLTFDSPYGVSAFSLSVRKWRGSTDVIVKCTSCQFLTGFADDKTYRVRFDDESPIRVLAYGSSSGAADVVFLGSASKIIKKLKTSKKVIIEPEFYNSGYHPITFSAEGFEWK